MVATKQASRREGYTVIYEEEEGLFVVIAECLSQKDAHDLTRGHAGRAVVDYDPAMLVRLEHEREDGQWELVEMFYGGMAEDSLVEIAEGYTEKFGGGRYRWTIEGREHGFCVFE